MTRIPRIALINDTSLFQPHFGCQLVCQTFREQFARVGLSLSLSLHRDVELDAVDKQLEAVDLVVINGEGSIHHNKNHQLLDLASQYPSVLLNCVYEANDPHPGLNKFLYVSARESASAAAIKAEGVNCEVVPDGLFASSQLRSFYKTAPIEDLGFTDNVVKRRFQIGPVRIRRKTGFRSNSLTAGAYLKKLCSYRRLCIGRFHAAVAASVLEIPFSTWDSNTWKTRAMMKDMGMAQLHYDSYEEALANVPNQFDPKIRAFAQGAPKRIEASFDQIALIARQQAGL